VVKIIRQICFLTVEATITMVEKVEKEKERRGRRRRK